MKRKILSVISNLIPLLLALYIAISFFYSKNLFNDTDIYFEDYPRFIFKSYILYYNITWFNSIFGYYPNLYSGLPMIQFYPIGMFFITNLLHGLGFSYSTSLKILIFLSFIILAYTPFTILRIYKSSMYDAIISTAWLMFAINPFLYNLFEYGMIPYLLAFFCTIMFISILGKRDFNNKDSQTLLLTKIDYLQVFLFSSAILINYMAIIFAGACMIVYMISFRDRQRLNNYVIYCLKLSIISAMITAIWIIPTITIQIKEIQFSSESLIFSNEIFFDYIEIYLKNNRIWIIGLGIFLLVSLFSSKKHELKSNLMIFIIFFLSIFFVFITPMLNIEVLIGINSMRYLTFFEVSSAILIAKIINIEDRIAEIKKIREYYRMKREKTIPNLYITYSKILFALAFILLMFGTLFYYNIPNKNYQASILSKYEREDGSVDYLPVDYTSLNPDIKSLIDWINNNTDNQSRILIQDSGEESGHIIGNGHNLCLLPLYTDRMYANGYLSHHWYKHSTNSTFIDDLFLGIPIGNATDEELYKRAESFNIEYIITWSSSAKNRLHLLENSTGNITNIKIIGIFTIFRIMNASRNFFNMPFSNLEWNPSTISVSLRNVNNSHIIIFKMHDFPNWEAYINNTKVKKINSYDTNPDNLIIVEIPLEYQNSQYLTLKIIWRVSGIENASLLITLITLLGIAFYPHRSALAHYVLQRRKTEVMK